MKKQQESLKNMVYQAILNGIFTDEYKPNQIINEGRSWYRNSAAARHRSVKPL